MKPLETNVMQAGPDVETGSIRVSDVRKTFQTGDELIEALRGVSFEVPAATCSFFVGPSGSGKSTLLYLLGGLDRPTSGTIEIDGEDLTRMNEVEQDVFRRRKIGFVFQQFNLIHNLTAVDNVLLAVHPRGADARVPHQGRRPAPPGRPGPPAQAQAVEALGRPAAAGGDRARPRSRTRPCCWPMSRPATSITKGATRSSPCCASSKRSAAALSSSSPTTAGSFDRDDHVVEIQDGRIVA